ncbi:DUF2851 family protein [Chloroflexota bacterium]
MAVGQRKISESQVVKIWQHQLLDITKLATEDGESIEIVYPGRINDDQGADFRDAVIATSHGLVKGDIEIHVKSGDWRLHRHHCNPDYNRVILHVVMWHDSGTATELQNGRNTPILALHKYLKIPVSQWSDGECFSANPNMPCLKAAKHLSAGIMAEFLDSAGEERFLAKAARFQVDIAQIGASQCLYQGIMGALGYSKNKLPCLELAHRLPLQVLESMTQDKISDEECLVRQQALLLGTAGLLPSQCQDEHMKNKPDDKWVDKLERFWASSSQTEAISRDAWQLFKVRPSNFPTRRIVAMSYLLCRYQERGLFEAVVRMIKKMPLDKGYQQLEEGLVVITTGYWARHLDFGVGSGVRNQTLLGRRRAADTAVNVLLPFALAWGRLSSQPELEKKAFGLYRGYPKLVVNSIERHMREQLGLSSNLVNSARRQQGLIHIYNTLCTQGKCHCCTLGGVA